MPARIVKAGSIVIGLSRALKPESSLKPERPAGAERPLESERPEERAEPLEPERGGQPEAVRPDAVRHPGAISSEEAEMILAETRLMTCKLLNDAKQQAEETIDKAREQADQILAQAEADAAQLRELAGKEGYEAGYRDGQSALESGRQELMESKLAQEKAIEQERVDMIRELEPAIVELSLQIARRVVHAELKLEPKQIANIAEAVLAKVVDSDNITLKVSPDDYVNVTDLLADENRHGAKVRFRADNSLESGDCLAVTPLGVVDGTVEGQLEEIKHRLTEVARNG
jgi:flagellar assembly protein FliH